MVKDAIGIRERVMVRTLLLSLVALTFLITNSQAETIDSVLKSENTSLGIAKSTVGLVDDMAFIRRASVDLIGRIPVSYTHLTLPTILRV